VYPLQLSCRLHCAKVAPDSLLRDAQSIRDVDDVDASVGGQQVGNRLIASSGLRVLDGHGFLNSSALAANISTAHLVGVDRMSAKDL
jgi:hypothetical protein